ncbi:MAG: hypothetical protein IPK33_13160 [Gemmatimonadetes bacterium]|nr:hypothetical protein [Gemmatimonadota bacterium]
MAATARGGGPGALHWEIDEFTDRALVLAEIELPAAGDHLRVPGLG